MPARLRSLHPVVIAHDDMFSQDVDDEVWLREAGRRGWVVLTRDDKIRYRPGEQQASTEAGTAVLCLNPSKGMTRGGYVKGVNRRGQVRHLFLRGER